MKFLKDYIAQSMLGKKMRFRCNCLYPLDFVGRILDYNIKSNEIVWVVSSEDGKIINIGENHPNMEVEQFN